MHVKILYRKALYVFLSCWLVLFTVTPSFAEYNPNKPHTRWYYDKIINDPTIKSTVEVKANRNYPVTVVDPNTGAKDTIMKNQKTTIKIPANAAKVGKRLLKGGVGGVIGAAVYDILGKSVDWVLDPQNNSVKYKDDLSFTDPSNMYYYDITYRNTNETKSFGDPQSACDWWYNKSGNTWNNGLTVSVKISSSSIMCQRSDGANVQLVTKVLNPDYDPSAPPSDAYKHIPINTVAQKVIEHANEGQAPAMQVMSDTALDALESGELDDQLESKAEPKQYGPNEYEPGTEPNPEPNPDPENPNPNPESPNPEPTPTEWPAFCDWATLACDYYDWAMGAWEPPEGENTEVDIQQPDIGDWQSKATASYVQFNGQCPADVTIPINYMGASTDLSISYQPFCHFASMIKPAVILGAWISAMLIISGGRAKES